MKFIRAFYNTQTVSQKKPFNLKEGDLTFFGEANLKVQPSALFFVSNSRVSPIGIIYKHFISIKSLIVCYDSDFKKYRLRYFIKHFIFSKKIKLNASKKYIIIFDNYSGPKGFAHWLCDGLTRMAEINAELKDYTVLIPEYFKREKLYLDTLSFFNIKDIEYLKENTITTVPNLFIPSPVAPTGIFIPENIKKLRNIVIPQIPKSTNGPEYIYISRNKSSRRFVENESEIVHLLSEKNFRVIYSEEYSFKEQIQLIKDAKIVVSIHGAALSLAMFMQEGAHILEFRKKNDKINNMYYSLCNAAGVNYSYLFCDVREISETGNNFNLIVDPDELKSVLEFIMNEIKTPILNKS